MKMIRKYLLLLVCFTASFLIVACGSSQGISHEDEARVPIELAGSQVEGTIVVDSLKHESEAASEAEDVDHDLIADASDNCPSISNEDQADADSDGIGDACANL